MSPLLLTRQLNRWCRPDGAVGDGAAFADFAYWYSRQIGDADKGRLYFLFRTESIGDVGGENDYITEM